MCVVYVLRVFGARRRYLHMHAYVYRWYRRAAAVRAKCDDIVLYLQPRYARARNVWNLTMPQNDGSRRLTTATQTISMCVCFAAEQRKSERQSENGMSENREMFSQAKYNDDTQICGCEKNHRASNSSQRRRWRWRIFALTSQTNTRKTPTHKWRAHGRQTHMCDDSRWWARGTRLHKFCCVLSLLV